MFNMSSPLFLFECRAKSISISQQPWFQYWNTLVTLRVVRELGLPYPFKASLFETNSKQPCCHASDLRIRIYNDQNSPGLPCSRWYWPTVLTKRRHHGPQYLARYGHGIMEITSINMSFKDLLGRTSIISGTSGRSVKIDHEPCYSYTSQEFVYISYLVIWS